MIQSSQVMNSIGKQRCIHRHPIRRSLRNICYDASLYEQFADIFRGVVIPIYNESTGLTDIGFVNFVPFIQNSASATELRSMMGIYFMKSNNISFAQTSERMKQFSIRNFIDNFIRFSAFGISEFSSNSQIFQILDNNRSIVIGFTQGNNPMRQFPTSIFNEVIFVMFQSFKRFECFLRTQISKPLKFGSSSLNYFSLNKNIFSKIEMSDDHFTFFIINRKSNIVSVSIYSNNKFIFNGFFKLFFNEDLNSKIFEQKNRTDNPTINQMLSQTIIRTILNNRDMNSFTFSISCNRDDEVFVSFYGKHSFVKSDGNRFYFLTNFSPQENLKKRCLNKSTLEIVFFSKIFINHGLEFISCNSIIEFPNLKNFFRTSKIFIIQFRDFSLFSNCRFPDIDWNYFLHRNNKTNNQSSIYFSIPQFIPHLKEGDFLRRELKS